MIIGLQIIAILFALSMIYFAVHSYKRKELTYVEVFSWLIVWGCALIVIVFPEFLRKFASTFFVTRVFDLTVVGGFVLVITVVSTAYVRTKRLEKKLEDLVRRESMKRNKNAK